MRTFHRWQTAIVGLAALLCVSLCGCSGGGGQVSVSISGGGQVSLSISPSSATVQAGQSQEFTATVTGSADQSLQWYVNGVYGGNATVGTISQTGSYTAPAVPPRPNTVSVTATSIVGPPFASASAQMTVTPGFTDFSALPAEVATNLSTFFVSGFVDPGDAVAVNGTGVSPDSVGNFVSAIPLTVGANRIELDIQSAQKGSLSFVKTVTFDPTLSTAGRRLLYVSSIASHLSGTIVIDLDNNIFLGFIKNKHVRGISPDGKQAYMDDLSVVSTATHQELPPPSSPLAFTQAIPSDGFLVSPDGTRLYSRDEVLDVATNRLLPNNLPVSIETGNPYDGPDQGGPAISPDGKRIFCGPTSFYTVTNINTDDYSITDTGIKPQGSYLSDVDVTPDGRFVLITSYGGGGGAEIFDANSFKELSSPVFSGDFAGQIVVSTDGTKAIFGNAGNPQLQGGTVTVIDIASFTVKSAVTIDLADHLAISDRNDVFVSSGDTPGIDVFTLQSDGTLLLMRQFVLGINQFMLAFGAPQEDDIEKIVFKP